MKKQYKYYALQNEIKKHKENHVIVGDLIGITSRAVRYKLDGINQWTIGEIDTLCKHYNMDYYELFKRKD